MKAMKRHYVCGFCSQAPRTTEPRRSHRLCRGSCLCADHSHLPEPIVVAEVAKRTALSEAEVEARWSR